MDEWALTGISSPRGSIDDGGRLDVLQHRPSGQRARIRTRDGGEYLPSREPDTLHLISSWHPIADRIKHHHLEDLP